MSVEPMSVMASPVELYEAGWSLNQIARAAHYANASVVRRVLLRAGVKLRSPGMNGGPGCRIDHAAVEQTVDLYMSGLSTNEVGAILGISHSTVGYRLRLAGVELRSRGESIRLRQTRTVRQDHAAGKGRL